MSKLVSVYRVKGAKEILYELLRERSSEADKFVNISHRKLPRWKDHVRFVDSKPYAAWYLIRHGEDYVGTVYLSKSDEIGIVLLRRFRGKGFGPQAVAELLRIHKRKRYLANINPKNERSIGMFSKLGFVHIQNTYSVERA